ncbi:MAG: hypothetical protein M1835_007765, partial [Candelina submexicana]
STFESIFEKYSKDFSTVGDEIDLETGEIVINNGHLRKMRDEQDAGKLLNMLMAAPGDYDDLGDYEAEEIERKAILAIPELEDFFAESHNKENAGGAWTATEENRASLLDSGLEETLVIETNGDGSTLSSSPSELPSSTDILRQFGTNLGPRIIQYVAHLQAGSNSKVKPFWHTPALPQPPSEKANVVQSIQNPLPQDRASSPTVHSIWGSEGTKAQAKKKHLRSATEHANKNAQKSTGAVPSKDLQCAPLEPLQNGVLDYSPNTRRKPKGDVNTTVAEIKRKLDDGLDDSLESEKPPQNKQPESAVHQKEVASDQHPVPNVKLRRSARLSSTSDVNLDIEYSKSPMKAAFVAAGQGRQPDEMRIFPSE